MREMSKKVKKNNNTIQYGITTPGIFAFIYYSGSQFLYLYFYFAFSFTFERFVYFIFNNLLLCSILSQVIAYDW